MAEVNITLDHTFLHELFTGNNRNGSFSKLLELILNQILKAEATEQVNALPYERSNERNTYRNGYRDRSYTTRIGTITLEVPRLRNGEFKTEVFNRYQRSEQSLILAMIEMVVNGVSTRKVKSITEELCGKSFSKSTVSSLCKQLDPEVKAFRNRPLNKKYPFVIVDAIYLKVREDKKVRSKGILIATAVNEEGYREVIGFQIADSESEISWSNFFSSLKERGLQNVDIVVSDSHQGLVKAIAKCFQGASWQRCQTHFSRNILAATPKRFQPAIKESLRNIYQANNIENARKALKETIDTFEKMAPNAIDILEEGFDDITTVISLPLKYRKRLRTSNSIERMNEEIRRRERVIRIFPNEQSAIRMIGALLIEHNEKWLSGRKYLYMEEYFQYLKELKK